MPQEPETPPRIPERIEKGKALSKILQSQFRLSAPEAETYISLLLMGQLTPSEISYYSGMPQDKVDSVLKTLSEKRLVRAIAGIVNRYFALAPYKIFADSIQDFQTQITTLQKTLLTNREKATSGINARLEQVTTQIIQSLTNWRIEQNRAYVDTWNTAKNMLETTTQDLQDVITKFSNSSSNKLSKQTQLALQVFQKSILKGMKQLQETLTKNLKADHQAIIKQGKTSEQCLTTASTRLLQYLETASANLKAQFLTSKAKIQKITETSTSSITSDFTSSRKQIQKEIQQVTTDITKTIEDFDEKQNKTISDWQKYQIQAISTTTKRVNQQIRESGRQRLELLDQLISRIAETHREELEQLTQTTKVTTAKIDSTINNSRHDATEMGDILSKSLQKAITEYSQSLKQLKTENAITQFSPEKLTNRHLTKIKESLTRLTQQASEEYEKLLDSVNETLGAQVSRAYLGQLAAMRTLLDELQQDLSKQQSSLTENIESIARQVTTETSTQIANLHRTANTTIQDLQKNITQQEKLYRDLEQQMQVIMKRQASSVSKELDRAAIQIREFIQDKVRQTEQTVEQLGATSTAKITLYRDAFEKQMKVFETNVNTESDICISSLQQELKQFLETVDKIVNATQTATESLQYKLNKQASDFTPAYRKSVGQHYNKLREYLLSEIQKIITRFVEMENTLLPSIIKSGQEARQALEESLTNTTASIEESTRKVNAESEERAIECKSSLKMTIDNARSILTEKLATTRETLVGVHSKTLHKVIENLTAFQGETDKVFTVADHSLGSETSTSKETIGQEINQSTQELAKGVEDITRVLSRNTQEAIKLANETLRSTYEETGSEIQHQIRETISLITQLSDSAKETLLTQTRQISGKIDSQIEEKSRSLEIETQTSTQTITTAITESKELATSVLNDYTENVVPLMKSIQVKSESTGNMLSNLWDLLGNLQTSEIERTWHIVTTEKVQIRLKDMLRRARSTITLAFPNFDEVPQETLRTIAPNVRIHLITKIDDKHTPHVQKLLKQGNIRIWHTLQMTFYAGVRDSEEVLIAPVHGDPQEVVAIVSDQESYISLFNKALGPRWISGAKEIRRSQ